MNTASPLVDDKPLSLSVKQTGVDMTLNAEGFVLADASLKSRTLQINDDLDATESWARKQDEAMTEYLKYHVQEDISAESYTIYKFFSAYIGNVLHSRHDKTQPNVLANVLDIGCGIGKRLPLYMRSLVGSVNYIGLDAININLNREYSFICARLEALSRFEAFHNTFDMFIFGTSLDHFENIDVIARAVRKLAAPNASVVFWIGLHDAPLVARMEGAHALERIFEARSPVAILSRFARFVFWSFPRLFMVIRRRKAKLKRGEGVDNFHFWYFCDKDLPSVLSRFGEIEDISMLPGSNSVFATCRIVDVTSEAA